MTVTTIRKTPNPQSAVYLALHSCYSLEPAITCSLSETIAGEIIVKRLLAGNRGHYSPLEQVSITFNCAYVPHSAVAQLTRHRHVSFSVQSFRYTAPIRGTDIEDVVYLRPAGTYQDRQGNKIQYTEELRAKDKAIAQTAFDHYCDLIDLGFAPEHARGILPYDLRQHFMCTFNARALLEVIKLRHKADAQLEIQKLSDLFLKEFDIWMPAVATWFREKQLK